MTYKFILHCVVFGTIASGVVLAQSPSSQRILRKAYKQPSPSWTAQGLENAARAIEVDRQQAELYFDKQLLNWQSKAEIERLKAEWVIVRLEAGERLQQAGLNNQKAREALSKELTAHHKAQAAAGRIEVDIRQELKWTKAILRTSPDARQSLQQAVGGDPRFAGHGPRDVALVRKLAAELYEEVRATSRGIDFTHVADAKRYLDAVVRAAEQAAPQSDAELVQAR